MTDKELRSLRKEVKKIGKKERKLMKSIQDNQVLDDDSKEELFREFQENKIKEFKQCIDITEKVIQMLEDKLVELKEKKEDKLVKKFEKELEVYKTRNAQLHDAVIRMGGTFD